MGTDSGRICARVTILGTVYASISVVYILCAGAGSSSLTEFFWYIKSLTIRTYTIITARVEFQIRIAFSAST